MLDPESKWAYRFHRDEKSWIRDPMVFVDMGREVPRGEPPLLKTRVHLAGTLQRSSGRRCVASAGNKWSLVGDPLLSRRT